MFEQNIFDDLTRKSSSAEGATFHSIILSLPGSFPQVIVRQGPCEMVAYRTVR